MQRSTQKIHPKGSVGETSVERTCWGPSKMTAIQSTKLRARVKVPWQKLVSGAADCGYPGCSPAQGGEKRTACWMNIQDTGYGRRTNATAPGALASPTSTTSDPQWIQWRCRPGAAVLYRNRRMVSSGAGGPRISCLPSLPCRLVVGDSQWPAWLSPTPSHRSVGRPLASARRLSSKNPKADPRASASLGCSRLVWTHRFPARYSLRAFIQDAGMVPWNIHKGNRNVGL
jgi:hypothetical protein